MSEIEIPKGWTKIEDLKNVISTLESGKRPKGGVKQIFEGIPSLGGEHLTYEGKFDFSKIKFVPEEFFKKMKKGKIQTNDILMVKDGATTGKTSFVDETFQFDKACINEHVFIIRTNNSILPKFLYYFFKTKFAQDHISQKTSGIIGGIKSDFIKNFPFIYPEDKEIQKKIIAKLDHILGELGEKKKEILSRIEKFDAKKINENYKNHLLKLAFEGRLTEKWRKENTAIESSSDLLKKIHQNKQQILKNKFKETNITNYELLPPIPSSWIWVSADQLTKKITDGEHQTPIRTSSGILLLSARNVHNGKISLENVDYISQEEYERISRRLILEPGDVLMSCSGTVGRSCVVPENIQFSLVRSVAVLKPFLNMGHYLSFCIRSPQIQKQIENKKKNTAQANIFQNQIKSLAIPLAPINEQLEIVQILDKKFTEWENHKQELENIQKRHETIKTHINNLTSSILNDAFSGKLVN